MYVPSGVISSIGLRSHLQTMATIVSAFNRLADTAHWTHPSLNLLLPETEGRMTHSDPSSPGI